MNNNRDADVPGSLQARIDEYRRTHEDIPGLMDRLEVGQLTLAEARLFCRALSSEAGTVLDEGVPGH